MKIKITRKHIKSGEPESADSCPIALALMELGFDQTSLHVFCSKIKANKAEIKLPISARKFISAFDDHKPVKPFSFNI